MPLHSPKSILIYVTSKKFNSTAMKKILFLTTLMLLCFAPQSKGQAVAIKTNLLYGGYALTPNLGLEIGLCDQLTLDVGAGYNPWNRDGGKVDNKKLVHYLSEIELRYWTCGKFNGLFLGVHGLATQYNIAGHDLPALFGDGSDKYRFDGYAYGAGLSVGYQFILARHWNLELNLGGGYARMKYAKYDATKCGKEIDDAIVDNYWGITRGGVSILFVF